MSRTYSASSMASSSVLPGCDDIRYGTTNCFMPASVVDLFEQLHELLVHLMLRLAHHAEHGVGHMLGRHAQLPAHVVLAQLAHKRLALGRGRPARSRSGCPSARTPSSRPAASRSSRSRPQVVAYGRRSACWHGCGVQAALVAAGAAAAAACRTQAARKFAVGPPTSWM